MTDHQLTRRRVLTLTSGAAAAGLAGCLGDGEEEEDVPADVRAEVTAYAVTYHWGFTAFDEDGNELDVIEVEPGTELTLKAVNDHASDAFEDLPGPVAAELEGFDALERTKQKVEAGDLPEPSGGTIEEAYEEAHGGGHNDDDGHGDGGHSIRRFHDDGDDDGHGHNDGHGHDDAMLAHGLTVGELGIDMELPGDMHEPAEATAVVEDSGTYEARCTIACGYGHTYQQELLIEATGQ